MALKCAIQLSIPDAIHKHGKPITINELANSLSIHPNKAQSLQQLMRLLVHSHFFSATKLVNGEEAYSLTLNSQLLLQDHPFTQATFALLEMEQVITEPSHCFSVWFRQEDDHDESPFYMAQGKNIYERMPNKAKFNELFNQTMANDSRLISSLLLSSNEFKGSIEGIESLVDVGGGVGIMAKAIAEAYPKLNCIVFDLPHVVKGLQGNGRNLTYVAGDMFEAIPRAHAVLLKWALHNWNDDNCIKVLQRCREAIPSKNEGGKVIIIEIVVGIPSDTASHSNSQFLMDMQMLSVSGGKERTEEQWKYLFDNAGFSYYKILPILGARSVIVVYPT
ncbi:hypothetical protein BVRB_6g137240 [Beta vulgaris subsp. vulgaris]|nr:hypothetical protein BVRB_6g137240 [Beta vulgaris subsp. vulgaris]